MECYKRTDRHQSGFRLGFYEKKSHNSLRCSLTDTQKSWAILQNFNSWTMKCTVIQKTSHLAAILENCCLVIFINFLQNWSAFFRQFLSWEKIWQNWEKCFHKIPTLEGRATYNVRLRDFASATVWKPFLIALSLMFFFQFSGINVILHYTVDIFQSADSSVEKFQVKYFLTASMLKYMVPIISNVLV